MKPWGWAAKIWEAGFNQCRQETANPAVGLYATRPDVVMLRIDSEDLFADWMLKGFQGDREERRERTPQAVGGMDRWATMIRGGLPDALIALNTVYLPPVHALTGLEYHSPWGLSDLTAF
jgi:hypothetical protein